jgi:hypothetical protein
MCAATAQYLQTYQCLPWGAVTEQYLMTIINWPSTGYHNQFLAWKYITFWRYSDNKSMFVIAHVAEGAMTTTGGMMAPATEGGNDNSMGNNNRNRDDNGHLK